MKERLQNSDKDIEGLKSEQIELQKLLDEKDGELKEKDKELTDMKEDL